MELKHKNGEMETTDQVYSNCTYGIETGRPREAEHHVGILIAPMELKLRDLYVGNSHPNILIAPMELKLTFPVITFFL